MLLFNIILVLALIAFVGSGLKDGFIYALGRIVGAVIGFLVAKYFYIQLAFVFSPFMPAGWAKVIAFLLIFMVATRVMGWIFKAIDKTFNFIAIIPFMKSINHVLGAFLGLLEGILIMGGLIWIIKTFNLIPSAMVYINGSSIAVWIFSSFTKILWLLI